jgi:formylglycine-generating enzyme required for sulfatase activity
MRILLPVFAALVFSGCMIRENKDWDNALDPANASWSGMRAIERGTFLYGSYGSLPKDPEEISYAATVSRFLIDTVEVTQELYRQVTGKLPEGNVPDCPRCPVVSVSWFDAVWFCNQRSKREGFDTVYTWSSFTNDSGVIRSMTNLVTDESRNGYRLPYEVEWEWASRGGIRDAAWPWGNDSAGYGDYAWAYSNAKSMLKPVAKKKPNGYGLYDMSGNAWEWVWDHFARYDSTARFDPRGPRKGVMAMFRGGSSGDPVAYLACANRAAYADTDLTTMIGFRCARNWVP